MAIQLRISPQYFSCPFYVREENPTETNHPLQHPPWEPVSSFPLCDQLTITIYATRLINNQLVVPYCCTNSFKNSFFPFAISHWNLSFDTKRVNSLAMFRNLLMHHPSLLLIVILELHLFICCRAPGSILAILFLSYSLVAMLIYFSTNLFTIKNFILKIKKKT